MWRVIDHSPAYISLLFTVRSSRPARTVHISYTFPQTNEELAAFVDEDGWIRTKEGRRQIWVPYVGFEVLESTSESGPSGPSSTVVEIRDPKSKDIVLRYAFSLDVRGGDVSK